MFQRLRPVLVWLAATAAVATSTFAVASPASADPGVSCSAPSISGTVSSGIFATSNRVYVSAQGAVSANCVSPFFDYKYQLSYYPASMFANASLNSADDVQSTSVTSSGGTTKIAFPQASWTRSTSGYQGAYVAISSYSKSSFAQTWPTEPTNVDWYFLPGYGAYDTAPMAQQPPPNLCSIQSFSKGGC